MQPRIPRKLGSLRRLRGAARGRDSPASVRVRRIVTVRVAHATGLTNVGGNMDSAKVPTETPRDQSLRRKRHLVAGHQRSS
jgi:hypothetical protein